MVIGSRSHNDHGPHSWTTFSLKLDLSSDEDRTAFFMIARPMKIGRFRSIHASPGKPSNPSLKASFSARVPDDDRVDLGTRDRRPAIASDARDAATSPAFERLNGT